jgi:hypothetical protein
MALEKCVDIDECQKWANKAEALASYAKQAHDKTLRIMADRIQARAIRRCGVLLKRIKPARGGDRKSKGPRRPIDSRSSAAAQAGMSPRQRKTALRVANVPKAEFEKAVESPNPPTVTELVERGKIAGLPANYLGTSTPEQFSAATRLIGAINAMLSAVKEIDLTKALPGVQVKERRDMIVKIITTVRLSVE